MPRGHYATRRIAEVTAGQPRRRGRASKPNVRASKPEAKKPAAPRPNKWPNPKTNQIRDEWKEAQRRREEAREAKRQAEIERRRQLRAACDAILFAPLNNGAQVDPARMERERRRIRGSQYRTFGRAW